MSVLRNISVRQNFALFAVMFLALATTVWFAARMSTDHLLNTHAKSVASDWARYLAQSMKDLDQIASGTQPTEASMGFLKKTGNVGSVYRYEIFNREGYSQLIADRGKVALVDLSEFSQEASEAARSGVAVVDVREDNSGAQPSFFSRAYVPVIIDGEAVAVLASYVDQTAERDLFYRTALIQAAGLCLLIALFFGVMVLAWWRRTKEKQLADRRIRYLAHHDVLTGLANRASLLEAMDGFLNNLALGGTGFAVNLIDLDRFKEVNDTLGHDGGDALLKAVADRLRGAVRHTDIVARLGGDEFVVVQRNATTIDEAMIFSNRLLEALRPVVHFGEQEIQATGSVGVALGPTDGNSGARLLKSADLALYQSKADGRNCVRAFKPEMDEALLARIKLERNIRRAIAEGSFDLHYQPVFAISGHELIGFEALARLPAEDGTLIPPMVFIPVAEELHLIDRVGSWVLREACRKAVTWPEHLTVAVNLSPGQFKAGSVADVVQGILTETGLAPRRLELEITESMLLDNSEAVMAELLRLKTMGVAIVMDDFGTGYSSLAYLWRFPFDKIKIDRSFMAGSEGDRNAETVVKTIMALGHELNMQVTVEGVETAEQLAYVDGLHGEQAQGFFLGRPMPGSEVAGAILTDFAKKLPPDDARAAEMQAKAARLRHLAG